MPAADYWIRFAERAERRASVERRRAIRWIGVAGALAVLLLVALAAQVLPRAIG